ncbi:hypothetical protein NPIL_187891 [Nephila pilipes]|uniref:Uncharacterized protein n=1 Tax=Nephila pilipes TaxID=299642 RepID=A0A8X6N568_NEPPI|nr:hypothetical protein NPIL_187891 [Nephila pilipes]
MEGFSTKKSSNTPRYQLKDSVNNRSLPLSSTNKGQPLSQELSTKSDWQLLNKNLNGGQENSFIVRRFKQLKISHPIRSGLHDNLDFPLSFIDTVLGTRETPMCLLTYLNLHQAPLDQNSSSLFVQSTSHCV